MLLRSIILIFPFILFSQSSNTITGRVVDKQKNEGLAGVNIMVKGTYYGSATDADGYYSITQVNPGTYDIEASIIGYKVVLQTGIRIEVVKSITIDFSMEPSCCLTLI